MTLQQLKYVSMVERCGSFSKAAQKLYVSQPSVSNLVHGLEEELHITIFQRTPSGVVITNEGRELLKLGNKLLRDADYIDEYFHAGGDGQSLRLWAAIASRYFLLRRSRYLHPCQVFRHRGCHQRLAAPFRHPARCVRRGGS